MQKCWQTLFKSYASSGILKGLRKNYQGKRIKRKEEEKKLSFFFLARNENFKNI